jgi:RNA 2',3'-cyclic 3'-phosphodiesterase
VRLFVALDLPIPVLRHLANVTAPLHPRFDVKWVPPEQMHATLVFAGDVPPEVADELADHIDDLDLPSLSLHLGHLGHFPPRGVPRVLWAGLLGDVEPLTELQAELAALAVDLGVPREKRPFTPHVTLGRVRSNFGAFALADELVRAGANLRTKPFAPTSLTLYESELLPAGPEYRVFTRRTFRSATEASEPNDQR